METILIIVFSIQELEGQCNGTLNPEMVRPSCYDTTLLVYKLYKFKHLHSHGRKERLRSIVEYSVVRYKVSNSHLKCLTECSAHWLKR